MSRITPAVPRWATRRRCLWLIAAAFLVVLWALGSGAISKLLRPDGAQAQDLPDFINRTPDPGQISDQVQPADSLAQLAEAAAVADCQPKRDAYERTLPVPSPTPGVPPNIGYVVQLVNESNQTLL